MNYWRIIRVRFVTILLVFLLTAVTTTVVSFLLPKTYMSMSRISVEKGTSDIAPLNGMQSGETAFDPYFIQTELEVIQSQEILGKVVAKCNLTNELKLWRGNELTEIQARKILEKAIDIRQFRNTSIIELRVYDRDKILARVIAQALAEEYQTHRTDAQKKRVEIIDDADLPVQAVRPNIPLNITKGVVVGLILGVGLAFLIEYLETMQLGWTPLHRAAVEGYKETVELLIAKGADVDARDRGGTTPLLYAAGRGRNQVAELLIAKGADVNAKGYRERTALHGAANGSWRGIAKLLIAKGADVNVKDDDGKTPLDFAEEEKQKLDESYPRVSETAALLRKHGGKTSEELKAEGK